ncbi:MAG: tRNA dihydrouridine synthase DusB [Clostridium sp.]
MSKLKIGDVILKNNVIIAPMAGISDAGFRKVLNDIAKPGLIFTEMVNARAIYYNDSKTINMLKTYENESPIGYQLFGDDEKYVAYAAKYLSKHCDILDINMGCPAPKVVKSGGGSELMKDLIKAESIIKAVVQNSSVPVTLKMRLGWDTNNINCIELAHIAERNGIKAITIHGRTRSQFFKGEATYDIIKKVKSEVDIPVIVNGDIDSLDKAKEVLEYTKADGISIARASLGKPYLIKEIVDGLEINDKDEELLKEVYNISKISIDELISLILKHLEILEEQKGSQAYKDIRKHVIWYTQKIPNGKIVRMNVSKIVDKKSLLEVLELLK